MTGDRRPGAAGRVDRACALVDQLGERVSALTRTCTRVVLLRASEAGQVGSWSTDELIGCTVLLNADSEDFSIGALAEAIVHEAIHHVQAMFEISRPFVVDASVAVSPSRYTSPWSGRPLTAKSLLAACFVWYSIAAMWARAGEDVEDTDALAAHRWHASSGFVTGDPAGMVAEFGWALDPEIPAVVSALQDTVRSQWAWASKAAT
jgi:HEXXH motif-containing protein